MRRFIGPRGAGVLALLLSATPLAAHAGGMELEPGGARSVGRGGAVMARPEDPTAMYTNPAGLTKLTDGQFYLDFDLPLQHMCLQPYGYYGWGVYSGGTSEFGDQLALDNPTKPTVGSTYATTPLGQVCNSARSVPVPQMGWAGKITDRFALAAGFTAPVVVPGIQYGGDDGTVSTPYGPRPTPTRYVLVKQDVQYALAPTVGAGYEIIPGLSAGLSVQIIMLRASATQVQNNVAGTQPSTDWFATLTTQDFFVPALTFSVHSNPIRALSLAAAFRWSDDIHGSGDVVYETNTFHRGATTGPVPFKNDPIRLADVTVRLPWQLTGGIRWAGFLSGASLRGDAMDTERWDIETDVTYSMNKRASTSSVRVGQDATVVTKTASGGTGSNTVKLSDLTAFNIDRHLKDSIAVRVGGSYSVVPRKLAINAGGFFETRGVEPEYADISTFAFQRVGVGAGLVFRAGPFDFMAAYGHIFSETLDLAPPPNQKLEDAKPGDPRSGFDQRVGGTFGADGTRQGGVTLTDPKAPDPAHADAVAAGTQQAAIATSTRPNRVINAGKYTASFDILSVGVAYHF